jgi:ATP-dependent helicase HrpB
MAAAPIDESLPSLLEALRTGNRAVLVAPPGAGKTTRVPVVLADQRWCDGKVLVLQPRRVAARAAASYLARQAGEPVGARIGYRVRLESRVSNTTRVEFLTEGVFNKMALDDPELAGVSAVLFDEFHERNLDADLGLALALDLQGALRPDLRLLVMSATLQVRQVEQLLGGAPVIESRGRSFPVAIRYRERRAGEPVAFSMAAAIRSTLATEDGSLLCFLPGQAEIRQTAAIIEESLPPDTELFPLHGGLEPAAQDVAITPPRVGMRKVVLATDVAETSLTIDGVRIVVDCGLKRVPRYEPRTGLTRLETVRASRAAVDQRAGRAGRTAPGVAIRLWRENQTGALTPQERPEIMDADLSALVLDLASWGVKEPGKLRWLDPPPPIAWREAVDQLKRLRALTGDGAITAYGRRIRGLPLPPRLAHMVIGASRFGQSEVAARLALLLTERGLGGVDLDLAVRLERLARDKSPRATKVRQLASAAAGRSDAAAKEGFVSVGALLSVAFPERIGRSREQRGNYTLANGRGAFLDPSDPLSGASWIVAADLQGPASGARIVSGAEISREEVLQLHLDSVESRRQIEYDADAGLFRASERRYLGKLEISRGTGAGPSAGEIASAFRNLLRQRGLELLSWDDRSRQFRARLALLNTLDSQHWPPVDDTTLVDNVEEWLEPFVSEAGGPADVASDRIIDALSHYIALNGRTVREAESLAPACYTTPAGSKVAIDYRGDRPSVAVRVQELYGLDEHPTIVNGELPLMLELLSPAMRPIQLTSDLPGLWRGSWPQIRREMRGRYPKHVWPENPERATPTTRAKARRARR